MNRLHSFLFFYWIARDIGKNKDPIISIGFMRQTSTPWKTGKGIQIRSGKYILQFGLCRKYKEKLESDDFGLLYAMQGRLLEEKPSEIGSW